MYNIAFLYVVDALIISGLLYACCSKYDLPEKEEEEEDIENINYLTFEE